MKIYYFFVFALFLGCAPKVSKANINQLNGYWVISEAKAPNGESRPYIGAVEVDFFKINEKKEFRKKLKPLRNNQFNKTNDKVDFTISFEEKKCVITYVRKEHSWQETVVTLSEDELKLKDGRGVVFHYKRYQP